MSDELTIRLPLLAVAMGLSEQAVKLQILKRQVPQPRNMCDTRGRTRVWTTNEIRAWRPDIADRCAALLHTLDSFPQDAA